MAKDTQTKDAVEEYKRRLQEITQIQFGVLSDDAILRFLAERNRLSVSVSEYERKEQEEADRLEREKKEAARKVAEKKRITLSEKIEELNKSISPDKKDDDLLTLVSERRVLEIELETINREFPSEKDPVEKKPILSQKVVEAIVPSKELSEETVTPAVPREDIPDKIVVPIVPQVIVEEAVVEKKEERIPEVTPPEVTVPQEEFGSEKIQDDGIEENSEFDRYFDQLKSNAGSLGEFLQQMPVAAKKNKAFMLKVATIDPAYAMHYADKDTLKLDEDFNVRIASLDNPRNSGNALSEMLPQARTSKVLLTAVKQDYRNIKFIQPNMAAYDEIMNIAKTGAFEKVKSLKEAADASVLIPRLLQQDKQFMLQIKEIIDTRKGL